MNVTVKIPKPSPSQTRLLKQATEIIEKLPKESIVAVNISEDVVTLHDGRTGALIAELKEAL